MATTAFGSLSVPQPDDSMEVSSPGNRNLDDDIDIDFDDYQTGAQMIDDENMDEDDADNAAAAPDELMGDDMGFEEQQEDQPQVHEEWMPDEPLRQDEPQQEGLEDEELIDYSEDDDQIQDAVVEDVATPQATEQTVVEEGFAVAPAAEQNFAPTEVAQGSQDEIDEEIIRESELSGAEQPASSVVEEISAPGDATQSVEAVATLDPPLASEGVEAATAEEALPAVNYERHEDTGARYHVEESHDDAAAANEAKEHPTALPKNAPQGEAAEEVAVAHDGSEEQTVTAEHSHEHPPAIDTSLDFPDDSPGTPTDTGLHPMTIRYGDLQMPLFKSRRQIDGLLKDDNLASLSLAELIKSCRQRISTKVGEDISKRQEFLLRFDRMGLVLIEDSRAAFETSLNEILEVYLQLHRNDEISEIPPLSLHLTLQLKFTDGLSILKQAAAGGQGMSDYSFLDPHHQDEEYDEAYEDGYDDEVEDGQTYEEDQTAQQDRHDGQEYDESTYVEQEEGSWQRGEQQEPQTQVPNNVAKAEDQNDECYEDEEQGYYDETAEEGQETEDVARTTADGQAHVENHEDFTEIATASEHQFEDQGSPQHAVDAALVTRPGSGASSATLQGDLRADANGEYSFDDIIDWDSESLTSNSSEPATVTQPDDHMTKNAGSTSEKASTGPENPEDDLEGSSTLQPTELRTEYSSRKPTDTSALSSENFLEDFGELDDTEAQQVPQGGSEKGAQTTIAQESETQASQDLEDETQDFFDETDTFEEQQDTFHVEHEAGDIDQNLSSNTIPTTKVSEKEATPTTVEHPEDDIGFDEDEREQALLHDANQSQVAKAPAANGTDSPLGKRSFSEHAPHADESAGEPELKRSRS